MPLRAHMNDGRDVLLASSVAVDAAEEAATAALTGSALPAPQHYATADGGTVAAADVERIERVEAVPE